MNFVFDLFGKAGLIFIGVTILTLIIGVVGWVVENIHFVVTFCILAVIVGILCLIAALMWKAIVFVYRVVKRRDNM